MNVQVFLLILTACSFLTSLLTEGIKTTLSNFKINYASNIIAAVTSVIVGGLTTAVYYMIAGVEFTFVNSICIVVMIIANWLGATVGYDKVKQTFQQIITTFNGGK